MTRTTLRRSILPVAAITLASGLTVPALGADSTYRVVARTGQAAPGGGVFAALGVPRISPNGRVAFKATLSGVILPSGVWSEGIAGMNNLELAAREGDPLPGLPGSFLGPISTAEGSLIVNATGETAFAATVTGIQSAFGDTGIFSHTAGGLNSLAAPGQVVSLPCEGFACQRWLTDIHSNRFAFNASGEIAYKARFDGTAITADNDDAIFLRSAAGVEVVLREGDTPPGTFGVEFTDTWWNVPHLNDNGEVLIRNYLSDVNISASYWSVWRGAPGALTLVAAQGWTTPIGGEFLGHVLGEGRMSFNNAGQALFVQAADNIGVPRYGVWHADGDGIEALSAAAMSAPNGMNYSGSSAFTGSINSSGDAAFVSKLDGPGTNFSNDGVLVRVMHNAQPQILAREGEQAPGLINGVVYLNLDWYEQTILNDGRVVFGAVLDGPGVHDGNDQTLWITRPGAEPALLIREGQTMVVGGQFRNVQSFAPVIGRGPETGLPNSISQLGQVAMRIAFTDGTQAIVVMSPTSACPGDANGDGVVDFADLNILLAGYGHSGDVIPGDLDLDGDIDFNDLNATLTNLGTVCDDLR